MDTQSDALFDDLLAQAMENPRLSWAGIEPPHPSSPLEFAFARRHAWGVQRLLSRGDALTPAMLESFFGVIRESKISGDLVGFQSIQTFWPVLLPSVVLSDELRHWVARHYFENQREGTLSRGVDWNSLSMREVIGDRLEEPFLRRSSMDVTPLQYACLSANFPLMETLLLNGANGHRQEHRSGLPGWTLAACLETAQTSLEQGWSTEGIQRWMWQQWGCLSQRPTTEGGSVAQEQRVEARRWFLRLVSDDGTPERHQRIQGLIKGQALEEGLPAPSPTRKGPRF